MNILELFCNICGCDVKYKTDIITGYNPFDAPIRKGLYQCRKCKSISIGDCGCFPVEGEDKRIL